MCLMVGYVGCSAGMGVGYGLVVVAGVGRGVGWSGICGNGRVGAWG